MTQGVWSWLPWLLGAGCAASGEGVQDPNVPDSVRAAHRAAWQCPHPQVHRENLTLGALVVKSSGRGRGQAGVSQVGGI